MPADTTACLLSAFTCCLLSHDFFVAKASPGSCTAFAFRGPSLAPPAVQSTSACLGMDRPLLPWHASGFGSVRPWLCILAAVTRVWCRNAADRGFLCLCHLSLLARHSSWRVRLLCLVHSCPQRVAQGWHVGPGDRWWSPQVESA